MEIKKRVEAALIIVYDIEKVPCKSVDMEFARHLEAITSAVEVIDRERIHRNRSQDVYSSWLGTWGS